MSGIIIEDYQSLRRAGTRLLEELGCGMVLITQGDKGMTLLEGNGRTTQIPTVARKVFDVSGAGDTVIGTFTLALAAGLTPRQAVNWQIWLPGLWLARLVRLLLQPLGLKRLFWTASENRTEAGAPACQHSAIFPRRSVE